MRPVPPGTAVSGDLTIYRTTRPELVALWDKWREEGTKFHDEVMAFAAEYAPEGSNAMVSDGGNKHIVGVSVVGDSNNPPSGWRLDRKRWILVPKRTDKIGKQIATAMDAVVFKDPRGALSGMPSMALLSGDDGVAMCSPGVEKHGDALYVKWSNGGPTAGIDPKIWVRVKLSDWYRVKEAEAEETA